MRARKDVGAQLTVHMTARARWQGEMVGNSFARRLAHQVQIRKSQP